MQEKYLKKSAAQKNAHQKDALHAEEKNAEDDRRNLNAKARLIASIFCICCFCMMIFLGQDDLTARYSVETSSNQFHLWNLGRTRLNLWLKVLSPGPQSPLRSRASRPSAFVVGICEGTQGHRSSRTPDQSLEPLRFTLMSE